MIEKGRNTMKRKPVGPLVTFLALMLPSLAAVWLLCTMIFGYAPLL